MSKRSRLAAPYVVRASLDYVRNPVDGKPYTCRHAYERAVKAAGCEIVGSEAALPRRRRRAPPEGLARDLTRAWQKLEA
jgi:hypothetical protein